MKKSLESLQVESLLTLTAIIFPPFSDLVHTPYCTRVLGRETGRGRQRDKDEKWRRGGGWMRGGGGGSRKGGGGGRGGICLVPFALF